MKKKVAALVLALTVLSIAAGCGEKKEDSKKTEDTNTQQEFVLTNKEGKVVAVDEKDLEKYVTLGDYKNLEMDVEPKKTITDEEVDAFIELQMINKYDPVEVTEDRAVEKNDTVNIDYTGYLDGETFEGGSAQGDDLLIGSGQFIEGFEEGLIGHKKGEEVTLDLTFPENYKEELKGKAVQFKVKINKISAPPALTDEWAAANTDYKTAAEYKEKQKEFLQADADNEYDGQIKSNIFLKVAEASEIKEYPEKAMEEMKVTIRQQLDNMYRMQAGVGLDEFLKSQNISKEEADETIEAVAKDSMLQNLVVQAIFNAEGIELTEEDFNAEKEKFALENGFPDVATMEKLYTDKSVIKNNVLWNRACEVILSTATLNEKEADAETEAAN